MSYKFFEQLTGYIINDNCNRWVPDVAWNKTPKSLLSCSIPDNDGDKMLTVVQREKYI
jgi:hypothetical protein